MNLAKGDQIVGAGAVKPRGEVVMLTETGMGKRTDIDQFPRQGRHGQGVIALPIGKDTGAVVAGAVVNLSNRVMMISKKKNSKTVYARALSKVARTHKGKAVMAIRDKDAIAALVVLET